MENQQENQAENTAKPKEAVKFNGVSHQINLGQGTETHRLFADFITQHGLTAREAVAELLRGYGQKADESQLDGLRGEIAAYECTLQNRDIEIEELKKQLAEANQAANANAAEGTDRQLQVEELQRKLEHTIRIHPFVWPYLEAEAEAKGKSPGSILQGIYTDMLQGRRVDGLKLTVSKREFRNALNKWKDEQNEK